MNDAAVETSGQLDWRALLADQLASEGYLTDPAIEAAFRAVYRHRYAPGVNPADAYGLQDVLLRKKDAHGATLSTVSAPSIQAMMLGQAQLRPGLRVLEIGSGGYNAALIDEVVGPRGTVVSIDIDAEIVERARVCLAADGRGHVVTAVSDGALGWPNSVKFDRIIVTVGAWDIPPAWQEQLRDDGMIVVPLRMRGVTRSVAFVRDGDGLRSVSAKMCGFVPMQGIGEHQEHLATLLDRAVGLRFDDGTPSGLEQLAGVLAGPRHESWSGVTVVRMEPFDSLHLWLATVLDGFCLLSVDPEMDSGPVEPQGRLSCPATVKGGSLAYLAKVRQVDDNAFEFGAHGFGPEGAQLAKIIVEQIRVWDRQARHGAGPSIIAQPRGTGAREPKDVAVRIDKKHTTITISWPPTA